MFKKMMVCLDGSNLAEQILPFAIEQATRFESKIVLFRAFSESSFTSIGIPGFPAVSWETSGMPKQAQKDETESIAYLKTVEDRIRANHDLAVESVTIYSPPGQAIVRYARENEVDLIAIATHGRSGLGRVVIGSVADFVIRESKTPILLIRPV